MAKPRSPQPLSRRGFLQRSAAGTGALLLGPSLLGSSVSGCGGDGDVPVPTPAAGDLTRHGALQPANEFGMRMPAGFTGRVIATSGQPVIAGEDYMWHPFPDGGATFETTDQGYIYVSNSEFPIIRGRSGVGAIRFDRNGNILDAYPILTGSTWNCSGGPTPWGTWLSGEEHAEGVVWECDPTGERAGVELTALGVFYHEAVAVDPVRMRLYLTEDRPDGRFYRFTPDALDDNGNPILTAGTLEVMQVTAGETGAVTWSAVIDPSAETTPTREQVPESTAFDGGEGVWYFDDEVYFTTKGDDRIWAHHVVDDTLRIVYDAGTVADPILQGVDFILATTGGDLLVAEDGDDMQVVAVSPSGEVVPLVQLEGHDTSEITGLAFDPTLRRLYFSSQRGVNGAGTGVTYEVTGPFFGPLG
ncbi:MAG: DUF839 domain-containing protein [Polyangiales bacterium]|nr:DUF839 domain-containing protein [Myxococcales bacterium]MCB9661669.1 DUF839 domain-containing protein [Sandaracinaceae bacterium]